MVIRLNISAITIWRKGGEPVGYHSGKWEYVGPMLGAAAQLFKQRVDENVERHGLTNAQSRVLLYLIHVKQGTETNQRDLEKLLDVKAPTVNGIVGRMEEKGFILRLPGKRDGRCRSITVTEKGRLLEREVTEGMRAVEAQAIEGFAPQEREQLKGLLFRVMENLKGGEAKA